MNHGRLRDILVQYFDEPKVLHCDMIDDQGVENIIAIVTLESRPKKIVVRTWGELHSSMGKRKDSDIEGELAFMEYCQINGVSVPEVFRSQSGDSFVALPDGTKTMVMDYVEGVMPANFTPDMLTQVAEMTARLHDISPGFAFPEERSWTESILVTPKARIEKFRASTLQVPAEDTQIIEQAIEDFERTVPLIELSSFEYGAIHGDIIARNMKFNGAKLEGLFDFDDCRKGYFLEDIAKTLVFSFEFDEHGFFGEKGEKADIFFEAYLKKRQLTPYELSVLPVFMLGWFLYHLLPLYYNTSPLNRERNMTRRTKAIKRYVANRDRFTTTM